MDCNTSCSSQEKVTIKTTTIVTGFEVQFNFLKKFEILKLKNEKLKILKLKFEILKK